MAAEAAHPAATVLGSAGDARALFDAHIARIEHALGCPLIKKVTNDAWLSIKRYRVPGPSVEAASGATARGEAADRTSEFAHALAKAIVASLEHEDEEVYAILQRKAEDSSDYEAYVRGVIKMSTTPVSPTGRPTPPSTKSPRWTPRFLLNVRLRSF